MYGMALVSSQFRDVVENIEPNVHQFAPVSIIETGNTEASGDYFWFIVGQNIDSVNSDKSTLPERKELYAKTLDLTYTTSWVRPRPLPDDYRLCFDRRKLNGAHIWVDGYLTPERARCSDVFKALCLEANITGIMFSSQNGYEVV